MDAFGRFLALGAGVIANLAIALAALRAMTHQRNALRRHLREHQELAAARNRTGWHADPQ